MKKSQGPKLRLSKETIHSLLPDQLRQVGGGRISCGPASACDCSGPISSGPSTSTDSIDSLNCTPDLSIMQR